MKLAQAFTGANETEILDPVPSGWMTCYWRNDASLSHKHPWVLGHLVTLPSVGDLASEG